MPPAVTAITAATAITPAMRATASRVPASRRRRRVFAILTALCPWALLLFVEAGLRLAGVGHTYPLFVPVEGAAGFLRVNRQVIRRFIVREEDTPNLWIQPVYFRGEKPANTFRVFVQGGSTAEGYSYGYGASPAGML